MYYDFVSILNACTSIFKLMWISLFGTKKKERKASSFACLLRLLWDKERHIHSESQRNLNMDGWSRNGKVSFTISMFFPVPRWNWKFQLFASLASLHKNGHISIPQWSLTKGQLLITPRFCYFVVYLFL